MHGERERVVRGVVKREMKSEFVKNKKKKKKKKRLREETFS